MTKLLKILGNSILVLVEIVMIFIIALALLLRTSTSQTLLAHKGAAFLSELVDSKVTIGKVDIAFIDRIYFDGLHIEDQPQDALAYIQEFQVDYNLKGAFMRNFNVDHALTPYVRIAVKKYKGEENLYLQF